LSKEYLTKSEFIKTTSISGLLVIERPTFRDHRGFFREVYRKDELLAAGVDFKPVQQNHSRSNPGVIRALHAERWNKLVYPIASNSRMFAAIADIRPESATFAKVETFEFSGEPFKSLYIPNGLANSICVVGNEPLDYIYLVDAYYTGGDTRAVAWNDPDLAINWPIKNPIISERDQHNPTLRELFPEKFI